MALRLSVGAGRLRVVRQLLTESVLLAGLGGALGVLVAIWGIHFLTLLLANGQANFSLRAELNWHVLGVATTLSVLTGVLFGMAPAMQSTRVDVMDSLREIRASQRESRLRVPLAPDPSGVSDRDCAAGAGGGGTVCRRTLSNLQSILNLDSIARNYTAVPTKRAPGRTRRQGDRRLSTPIYRSAYQRDPGCPQRQCSRRFLSSAAILSLYRITVPGMPLRNGNPFLPVGPAYFATMQIPDTEGPGI